MFVKMEETPWRLYLEKIIAVKSIIFELTLLAK